MTEHVQSLILPSDEHNQELVANVHPSDWVNPKPSGCYNIAVIGAGTAGLITAVVPASLGAKVALIEKHLIGGGDCLNVGCVPSKGVIRAARASADLQDPWRDYRGGPCRRSDQRILRRDESGRSENHRRNDSSLSDTSRSEQEGRESVEQGSLHIGHEKPSHEIVRLVEALYARGGEAHP